MKAAHLNAPKFLKFENQQEVAKTIQLLTEVDRIINYKFRMPEEDVEESEEKSINLFEKAQSLEAEIL